MPGGRKLNIFAIFDEIYFAYAFASLFFLPCDIDELFFFSATKTFC